MNRETEKRKPKGYYCLLYTNILFEVICLAGIVAVWKIFAHPIFFWGFLFFVIGAVISGIALSMVFFANSKRARSWLQKRAERKGKPGKEKNVFLLLAACFSIVVFLLILLGFRFTVGLLLLFPSVEIAFVSVA